MKAVGATTLTKGTKYSMKGTYDGKTVKLTVTNLSNGKIETASVNATGNIHGPDKGGNYEETVMALGCNPYGNEPHYGLENGARFANVSVYSAKVYSEKGCIASYEASRNLGALKDLTSNKDGTVLAEDWADDYILLDGKDDWINLGSMSFRTNQVTLDLTMELVSYPAYSTLMGNIEVGGVSLGLTDEHKPYMQINIGGTYYKATSPTALETGKKVHLLGSYDGNTIRFFINGQLVAQTEKAGIIQVAKSQTVMSIGSNPSGNSAGIEFTNMKVYTAHVYNKAYWDVSEKGDNSILAWNEKSNSNNAQKVYIASKGNIYANADASYMFSYLGNSSICTATTTITKLNSLNTSKTTNMQGMFQYTGSNAMTSLNLGSNFNTSKVKDMSKMFFGTGRNKMSTFNLGTNFDTVAVTNMSQMFEETGYAAMTSLNLGTKFNTAKVTDMSTMFADTGYKAMKTLTLGSNFNTSKVNDMSGMFWECGHDQLTSLDLGDLFYTSQATDMEDMFYDFGATSMTELDLGPAFNKMPTDTGIKSAGQSGWLKIYATEQVYSGEKAFKVSTSNSATTAITRGTIDPRYRVEWIIEPNSVSVDKTNKKMTIGLRARTNNNATSYYKSNITGSLGTGNITVYMDGEEASSVSKSLSGPTSVTNSTTGYNDVKYTLTLTGFEQSSRKSGKLYKEWSGNVSIEIAQGTVIDSYGNQDMAVKDGSRVNHSFDTEQKVDFIKPEFTYKYANTDIDKTNKRLIVDFTITDKFFTSSTTLKNASQVKVKLIDENKEIPASKIRKSIVYIDANGNEVAENSDSKNIYETRKGTKYKIGERYRLIVTGLEQSEYDDPFRNFSGTMSVTFPAGTVTDGSNNKNDAQIITIGINEPDKSGSAEIVDVVDPVWKASDFTVDRANKRATVTLTASDKYFKTSTLKESDITVKLDGATASNISKSLSTATKVANGVKYTLTLTNWEESTRQSGKYYYEWSGNVSLVIAANTIEDNSRNKSKQQTLTLGKADVLKPKIDNITVAQDKNNKTVTVGFDISDKYLKTSTRFNENNINVYIDGVNATSITKSLSRTDAGSNTVDGNTAVVRHHYVLTLSNFEQSTFQSGKSYKNWSGKLRVTVAGGIVQDTSDNSNDETELVNGEDVDFIKPSVTYVYSSGNIDHTTKTLTVDFTVADRYFSSSTATTDTVKNSIKVKLLDKNIDIAGLTKTVEKISDYNDTINGSTVKVGEKYRLTIGNLERTTETDGLRDYSGPMSITFPANMVMDKAQNGIAAKGNDAKTITIGISDPGSGSQEIVDVVSPVWEINKDETNLKTGTVKIRVKDKYLAVTNGKKDDLTLDISKVHVLVDKKESTAITKSITSGPTLITKGTNGYDTEYEYTIQLSNITPAGKNYIEFTPIETVVGGKAKYRDENGGAISLKIEAEAIKDAFKNTNAEQELEVGNIDNTGPEVFDIQKTIAANGDETFVFNITDKNYDPSKIVDISELNITIDGVQLSSNITKKLTCQTTITEQGTNIVRGHQYTLTLTGMKESVASFASAVTSNKRSYRENSGTVKIAINANAARDLGGNTLNTDTTTITSFNDKIAPEVVYKWSDSVINKNNKTFTMVFGITDKYYDASKSTKINVGELGITIDGKNPTGTTKTLSDPVPWIENGKTIGVKYTLVISNLQQLQIKDGDKYLDYSGVVTVTIPANKVKDTSSQGNIVKNITSGITIPGETGSEEIVDVVDPFWQVSDININKSTSQVTMTLKGTDKYFEKSTLTPNDIAVWIDGEEATSISRNLSPATELKDGSTKIGVQYTLTLSNWQESSKQSGKSYLEWSGDTKIKIAARKLKDTNDNYSIAQEFEIGQVDFIKPMIEKVSSTKGTNTETIVFDVNDKYISTKLSAANITTLINGEVADVKTTITSIADIKGTGIHSAKTVGHRYTVVISDFNKGRKNGRKYSDWSGTVSLRIAADAVQDTSQNKNNATTITGDFVDFIKPEITYIYSSGNIDPTTKTLTVDFTVADRYFYSSTVTTDEIIKKIKVKLKENDKEIPNLAGKITITKLSDYTDGSRGKVGENYRLTIGGLQQNTEKDGLRDYSGPMSITFPADMVKDKEPNSNVTKGNNAKTITIGINDPGSGSQQIVDVVSPVWSKVSSTLRPGTATATIRVKDKYLVKTDGDKSKLTLKSNELQVKINNKVSSNATITVKDGPKLVASGTNGYDTTYEYTIQISNLTSSTDKKYKEFQPIETIVGRTAKYREEDGGEVYLVINKGAIQDVFDNTSDAGEIYVGNLDNIGPEVYDVQKTIAENGDETFVFNITDQNYDTSKIVDISELNITIDGVQLSSNITKKLTCQTPITEKGTNIVRGHQYILTLTGMKESVASFANAVTSNKRVYREYSGTIKITINADAARDKSGNTLNTDTTTITSFNDKLIPEVVYQWSNSVVDKTNKTFTMIFDITDKYYASSSLKFEDLTIKIGGKTPNWTAEGVGHSFGESDIPGSSGKGKRYTLTLSNLQALQIKDGDKYLDYSGVVTVAIPANKVKDTSGQGNVATTLTSGITIPGGSGSEKEVDVVEPYVQKMSSTVNAPARTASITIRISDRYFNKSTLTMENIEVYINGTKNSAVKSGWSTLEETETRTEKGTTSSVHVATNYTLNLSNFASDINQIKVVVPANVVKDTSENGNKQTEYIIYNVLKKQDDTGEDDTAPFFGNATVQRQNIDNVTFVSSTAGKNSTAWDVSAQGDGSILAWYTKNSNGTFKVYVGSDYEIFGNTDSSYLFRSVGVSENCTSTETITNIDLLNVSNVTNMFRMFEKTGWTAMTKLDLGNNFDTSNVITMAAMFSGTGTVSMKSLNLGPNFNTSRVTDMNYMLSCTGYLSMTSLDLENNFDTSNVTNMNHMFNGCGYGAMTSLNLGGKFNTAKVTDMSNMFRECGHTAMTSLDLGSNFDTSSVTVMNDMFNSAGYTAMKSLNLGSKFNTSKVTDMSYMFYECGYNALTSLDLGSNFDTSSVTNMSYMFVQTGYMAMTSLNLGDKFDTSNVTNMLKMFYMTGHDTLTELDLGDKFNTSKVTNMAYMFTWIGRLKTLNLGDNFDTSNVTDMNGMFWGTGYFQMTNFSLGNKFNTKNVQDMSYMFYDFANNITSLDLGDQFYTTNATNMIFMFFNCGAGKMTSLDLGPAFTKIPDGTAMNYDHAETLEAYYQMFEGAGKSGCVIHAPESIFQDKNNFKLNTNANTADTNSIINYTRGTINPKYRTEWKKESATLDTTNKNIKITLRGTTNTAIAVDQYKSDVTSSLTKSNIKVYIDGVNATETLNKLNAISLGNATQTTENSRTGAKDVLQVVTLSNLEEAARQSGKSYKEWSGNIRLEIDQKTLTDTKYGNKNMAVTSTGARANHTFADGTVQNNTADKMFADYIKPEITYTYVDSDINHTNKTLTAEFILTDKYYKQGFTATNEKYDASSIIVGIDSYDKTALNKAITKTLTKVEDITDTVNGVANKKVGEKYRLVIGNLEQKGQDGIGDGYTYSGYMSLTFPEGTAVDNSGNKSPATTVSIGKNYPGGSDSNKKIVDVVDPVWEKGNINIETGVVKLRVKDKYLVKADSKFNLTKDKIKIIVNNKESTAIVKTLTGPVEIKANEEYEYTLTLSNISPTDAGYTEFTPKNPIVGGTAKYKNENGGKIALKIAAGTVTDKYGNSTKEQTIDIGMFDGTGPAIYYVQKTGTIVLNKETVIFNVTDKNYNPTNPITVDEMTVTIDGKTIDLKNLSITKATEIITNVDGKTDVVVGHQYTLEILNIIETDQEFVKANRKYRELSGALKIQINEDAAEDLKGNTLDTDTTTITDYSDIVRPEVIYRYSTSDINYTDKTFTMTFDIVDKYYDTTKPISLSLNDLTIKVDGVVPDWTKVTRGFSSEDIEDNIDGKNNTIIGKHYTLTLSGLEQTVRKTGANYADYSGVVTVSIPANKMVDKTTGNGNLATTLSSGVSIPNGSIGMIGLPKGKTVMAMGANPRRNNPYDGYSKMKAYSMKISNENGVISSFDATNNTGSGHSNSATTWKDLTGSHNGTLNGPTWGTDYLQFDGVDDWVNFGQIDSQNQVTVEATISFDQIKNGEADIVGNWEFGGYGIYASNGVPVFSLYSKEMDRYVEVSAPNAMTAGQKTKLKGVYDGTNMYLYVDDKLVAQTSNEGTSATVVDVVDPLVEKISSTTNAPAKTATVKFKVTDKYFANSTLTKDNIQVLVNGAVSNSVGKTLTGTNLTETRVENGKTSTVQYGIEYTLNITDFAADVNQIKVRIPADKVKDKLVDGKQNGNKQTEYIIYNVLKNVENESEETTESSYDSIFFGNSNVKRKNINNITFVSSTSGRNSTAWDVSAQGDNSIIAWYTTSNGSYNVYIGSDYEMFGNINSKRLFQYVGEDSVCTATKTITNLNLLNVSNVTNMESMFRHTGLNAMTELDLGDNFDTRNVTNMVAMFGETGYNSMVTLNLGNKFDTSNVTEMSWMFSETGFKAMTKLDLGSNFDTSNVISMYNMFRGTGYTAMTTLNLGSKFNTSKVTNMQAMFYDTGFTAMTSLDLGDKFDTSKVTDMSYMFKSTGYTAMTSLDLGDNFDTSNVTNTERMFSECGARALGSIDLGTKFDTSNVTNMNCMFASLGMDKLSKFSLGDKFDTSKVTDMRWMFSELGKNSLETLDLGNKFDTSNVTTMQGMFNMTGMKNMKSLDLGDKFDTSKVTDMSWMFCQTGQNSMTSLDLGPAFTKIPSGDSQLFDNPEIYKAYYLMFSNTGKSGCVIHAPESIFQDKNNFKLNASATTGTVNYTRGTINPKYRTEWKKEKVVLDQANDNIKITLRGTTNTSVAENEYISDVTSSLALNKIKVLIDGTDITSTVLNAQGIGNATQTTENSRTGAKDVLQTITLTNFAKAAKRLNGKKYKEWSGNITIEIAQGTLSEKYGNKNMLVATGGTRTVSTVKETNKVSKNTANTMFTDYIKPEFTYSSITDTNIVHGTGRKVEIMFDVTDKYFESTTLSNLNASQITIGIDDYDETELNKAITKKLEKVGTITDTVNGVSNVTVGERYKLTITGLEQQNEKGLSDGYTYSGYMSLKFAKGTIKDKSGNLSDATTITIGKNEPGGSDTDKTVVDIVDPVWTLGDVDTNDGTIKLKVKDKFLIKDRSKFELTTDKITIYADDVVSTEIEKQISGPVEIRANEEYEYTLTLLNIKPDGDEYEEFTPKNPIVGGTAKYKKENGGEITIEIAAGAITDAYGNKTKKQSLKPGTIDGTGPEVYDIQKTKDTTNNKETFVFNVTDKNYDSTDLVTIDELTVWLDGKQVDIDGEITKKFVGDPVEIITTVNGQERVVGHQYTLEIGSIVETNAEFVASNRKYRELSGTLEIKIATDAAKDKKGNKINPDTATITDFNDMIKPEVIYKYATSNIDKTNKIFKMEFDLVDKYCKTINNIAVTDLTIQIDGKVPDWTKVTRNLEVSDIKEPVNGTNKLIGRHYTLTLSNLEQLQVKSGDNYLDYSGVITVAIPANKMQDTAGNQNVTTTITSGVSIPAGTGSDTIVDVVDPLIEKISSNVDAPTKTATLNFKVTDKYFASSDLANGNIEILVNGAKNTTVAANNALTVVKNLTEPRTVDGKTVQVQYGIEYSLKISGFDANANQIKVRFPANLVKDKAVEGKQNGNKQTDIVVYNVLRSVAAEADSTNESVNSSIFLGNSAVLRKNIDNVTFVSGISGKNNTAWDVSAQGDGSILAWYTKNSNGSFKVYIGSNYEIFANTNSTNLFHYVGESTLCTSAETITNLNLLNVSSVTNMKYMFRHTGMNAMTKLDLGSNFNTQNVTNMQAMFGETGYNSMTTIKLGNNFDTSKVIDMQWMFCNTGNKKMTSLNLGSKFNTSNVYEMNNMFNRCGYTAMTTLNLGSQFNTGKVTNMASMFVYCGYNSLTSLDLGSLFDTSKVTNMSYMFAYAGYTAMTNLNLGANFDTSKVTNMSNMFKATGYTKMASLDLKTKFNTSKVTNMSGMFASTGHELMTTLDLGANFDTSAVTDMSSMFEATGYKKMATLNLREKFNTIKVTNMSKMFKNTGFTAMTSLDLGNTFYTTAATDTSEMFNNTGATAMTILDLGPAFDRIPDTNTDMFKNTGTAALVVYAPESIYSNVTTFIANRTRN